MHLKISLVLQIEKMTSQQTTLALNNSPKKITLKEYWGPLVLIIVGIIVSVIAAVAETMYFKYKGRVSSTFLFLPGKVSVHILNEFCQKRKYSK